MLAWERGGALGKSNAWDRWRRRGDSQNPPGFFPKNPRAELGEREEAVSVKKGGIIPPNLPSDSVFCKNRFQLQQRGDLGLEIFGLHSISNSCPVRTRGDWYSSKTGKRGPMLKARMKLFYSNEPWTLFVKPTEDWLKPSGEVGCDQELT